MRNPYTYGVVSKDGHWVSGLRPSPEMALDSFLRSREKRGEDADWNRMQAEDGYRLTEFYLTPTQRLENGEWVLIDPPVEAEAES